MKITGKDRIEGRCQFDLSLVGESEELKEQARSLKPFSLVLEREGKQYHLKKGACICVHLSPEEKVRVRVQQTPTEAVLYHQPRNGKKRKNTHVQVVVVQRILSLAEQDERRDQKRRERIAKALKKMTDKPSK